MLANSGLMKAREDNEHRLLVRDKHLKQDEMLKKCLVNYILVFR